MDIKQMHYFKTIVESGTILKAAQVLHMSQPPLSMQLKQLEDELGVQLLHRGHRKIEMTPAGRIFYKRCLQILNLTEMTRHEIQDTHHETLRIGVTSSNASIVAYLQDYIIAEKHLSFRIHEGSTYEIIDLLLAHNIDIGVVRTPFDNSQVTAYSYRREPMVAVGLPTLVNSDKKRMQDYQNDPLIIHHRYLAFVSDHCFNLHLNPFIKLICDDSRTSIIAASQGIGVALIPQSASSFIYDQQLVCVPLKDEELYTDIVFITHKHEKITKKTQEFLHQFGIKKEDHS